MTRNEFIQQPGLVMEKKVISLGYARATVGKYVDCGVLKRIKPPGCHHAHYQKRQLALLMGWQEIVARDDEEFAKEPLLMRRKAVLRWTGFSKETLGNIVDHRALRMVQPAGAKQGLFLKEQIAALIGMEARV